MQRNVSVAGSWVRIKIWWQIWRSTGNAEGKTWHIDRIAYWSLPEWRCTPNNVGVIHFILASLAKSVCFSSTCVNLQTPNVNYTWRTAPLTSKVAFYIFIQQIQVTNILNTVYTLRFFSSSKCSLFHNSNVFGSCIIHILYTGYAKIKKIISRHISRTQTVPSKVSLAQQLSGYPGGCSIPMQ
jgi:hypothetical protein